MAHTSPLGYTSGMGKVHAQIDEAIAEFIRRQHVFFVATAPLSGDGQVNLSPKGSNTFAVLDPTTVAYLDLTGSGIETVAHVRENGRITVLFCAFEGPPKILRLAGRGQVLMPGDPDFDSTLPLFPPHAAVRAIIRIALTRIADSCGYGVPLYQYERDRTQLAEWTARKGPEGIVQYRADNNAKSLDGLPGLRLKADS